MPLFWRKIRLFWSEIGLSAEKFTKTENFNHEIQGFWDCFNPGITGLKKSRDPRMGIELPSKNV